MRYVVMDLEWNNTYCKKLCGFINEIIEIGAVMLDEDLNTIDTFSAIIKTQIGKKLQGRVKKLTNLTNEDIYSGDTFQSVMHNFGQWMGDEPAVILTWADGDIRTLLSNYRYYYDATIMPFCGMYADLQKYCQSFLDIPKSQQVGLSAAAELLGIDPSAYPHHRALDDSILSADCLRQVYEKEKLMSYAKECDIDFYKRLEYKPHVISNIDNPLVDKSLLSCRCIHCGEMARRETDWQFVNQYFRSEFFCENCGVQLKYCVRFKKHYDRLDIRHTTCEITEETKQLAQAKKKYYKNPIKKETIKTSSDV